MSRLPPLQRPPSRRAGGVRTLLVAALAIGATFAAGFMGGWTVRATRDLGGLPVWFAAAEELPPADERPALLPPSPGPDALTTLNGPSASSLVHDPASYFRRPAGFAARTWWDEHPHGEFTRTTSALGLRLTGPLPSERPRPLIVLTGDSHMDGVCGDDETAAAVLEQSLAARPGSAAARVLNAATGMFTFPNYLGVAWRYAQLGPDALVVVVYGGNDFGALEAFEAELLGAPAPERPPGYLERLAAAEALEVAGRSARPSLWQALNQIYLFAQVPGSADRALEGALAHARELEQLAARRGTRLLVVYLPPAHDVTPDAIAPLYAPLLEVLDLGVEDVRSTDRLADRFLAGLDALGVESLDARPVLRGRDELLYWVADEHLNVEGQRLLGEALADRLAEPAPGF